MKNEKIDFLLHEEASFESVDLRPSEPTLSEQITSAAESLPEHQRRGLGATMAAIRSALSDVVNTKDHHDVFTDDDAAKFKELLDKKMRGEEE